MVPFISDAVFKEMQTLTHLNVTSLFMPASACLPHKPLRIICIHIQHLPTPPALGVTGLLLFSGSFTLAELGVSDQQAQHQHQTQHQAAYHSSHSELGLLQRGYSLSAGSDADSDPEGVMSPERAVQLWGGHGIKSRRSSGLSSRENSALTLTDSDNEHKSDDESGRTDRKRERERGGEGLGEWRKSDGKIG